MPSKMQDPTKAARAIIAAISSGTKKMAARKFFWALHTELCRYKAENYEQFVAFLRGAGVSATPTREQCAAAAKLARAKSNALLAPHGPIDRGY
jgi:hypothetical protein